MRSETDNLRSEPLNCLTWSFAKSVRIDFSEVGRIFEADLLCYFADAELALSKQALSFLHAEVFDEIGRRAVFKGF